MKPIVCLGKKKKKMKINYHTLILTSHLFKASADSNNHQLPSTSSFPRCNPLSISEIFSFLHSKDAAKPHMNDDYIEGGFPGQPSSVAFDQYAGYIPVGNSNNAKYFYYFVETTLPNSTSVPLVLWLNGAACSSLGTGAMIEHGPFGVQSDSKSLYHRFYSWNKVANMLYVEHPAFVGFSYSNRGGDYYYTHAMIIEECYSFVLNWFRRFPQYRDTDFYIAGEGYAGLYIPSLAETIFNQAHQTSLVRLKGVMIGNGLIDNVADTQGMYDYWRSWSLISNSTHAGLMHCLWNITYECQELQKKAKEEMGSVNVYNLNVKSCQISDMATKPKYVDMDPCYIEFASGYLNIRQVQQSLHVKRTTMQYLWHMCRLFIDALPDTPSTMLPTYKKLIAAGLSILVYSGDMDAVVPWTSTQYSVEALNLTVKNPWRPWLDDGKELAGHRVDYNGLSFATVQGAGHQVPKDEPRKAFSLVRTFLEGR